MKPLCLLLAFAPLALATTRANADTLYPGGRDVGKISLISKGVKELGVDSLFLVNYSKTGSGGPSSMRLTALGSGVFRYFVADNVALTVSVGGLYRMFDAEGKAIPTSHSQEALVLRIMPAWAAACSLRLALALAASMAAASRKWVL